MPTALVPVLAPVASQTEETALTALLTEGEAPVSDAPQHCPPAASLILILLSPKEPKETGR
ncbi:hypothetical protein [Streptomyces purpureus]|uniref:Uncharacterized protein n=1 Tax=Streptomyces purpureus TaxID=1951 RepID=A0A918HIB1_9ACTN|nr:hypothetical protein [Streptomyces purpureus]GGT62613.1 hypothetical protein GCM10014713_64970 [Streptomyces purpureus]